MAEREPEPLTEAEEAYYDALDDWYTDPNVELPPPMQVLTGDAAAASGRAFLIEEFGSEEALETFLREPGRPRKGTQAKGPSPTVRGRISEADFAAFKRLEQETGLGQSALVREAVHLLLERHRPAS